MITLATGLLARFGKPLLVAIALLAALAAFVGVCYLAVGGIYRAGFREAELIGQADMAKAQAAAERSRAQYEHKLDLAARLLKEQEEESALKLMEAQARVKVVVKRVEVAINENPAYAATERPADLQRVRLEDFAELADAAQRGADLSGAGVAGLPAAAAGHRPDPGLERSHRQPEPPPVADLRPRP